MSTITTSDVYGKTDRIDTPILETMATRLEARGRRPEYRRMANEYLDAMQIDEALTVLDLGCGTGVAARYIAERHGFKGHVTAIDLSAYLIEAGSRLAAAAAIDNQIEFRRGDSRSLELPDDSFDAVVAHTMVSHVDALTAAVAEMARVVKPGGFVGIFDGDYASMTFSHPDVQQGKAYDEMIIRAIITQPRAMRQMPAMLRATGLELTRHFAYVVTDVGKADYWAPALESFRKLLPAAGVMTAAEAEGWVDARLEESTVGAFFGSSNYYSFVARKA